MLSFKEILANDIKNIFLNEREFAEWHNVNGKDMLVSVDNNEQIEREKRSNSMQEGMFSKQILFYVAAEDFGALPAIDAICKFDRKLYRVIDAINEQGVYSITLEATRS